MISKSSVFLLVLMISACTFKPIITDNCITWEYKNCENNEYKLISYSRNNDEINFPVFKYSIKKRVIDSLCYRFLNDYKVELVAKGSIELNPFGKYYYGDSLMKIYVVEINQVQEDEFSYKCHISEAIYGFSEHSSWEMIYVPKVGFVYGMFLGAEGPIVSKVTKHCQFSEDKWKKKYREYLKSYTILNCGNKE